MELYGIALNNSSIGSTTKSITNPEKPPVYHLDDTICLTIIFPTIHLDTNVHI